MLLEAVLRRAARAVRFGVRLGPCVSAWAGAVLRCVVRAVRFGVRLGPYVSVCG